MKTLSTLLLLTLAACASITADSDQQINIVTIPASAKCSLVNGEGTWTIEKTPGTTNVKRAFSKLAIHCEKPGAGSADAYLEATTRGRAYGNILLLGVPATVDAATGDGYEYEHPDVTLTLNK